MRKDMNFFNEKALHVCDLFLQPVQWVSGGSLIRAFCRL